MGCRLWPYPIQSRAVFSMSRLSLNFYSVTRSRTLRLFSSKILWTLQLITIRKHHFEQVVFFVYRYYLIKDYIGKQYILNSFLIVNVQGFLDNTNKMKNNQKDICQLFLYNFTEGSFSFTQLHWQCFILISGALTISRACHDLACETFLKSNNFT